MATKTSQAARLDCMETIKLEEKPSCVGMDFLKCDQKLYNNPVQEQGVIKCKPSVHT